MNCTPQPIVGQAGGLSVWHAETLDVDRLLGEYGQRVGEGVLWLGHLVLTRLGNDARCRDAGRVPLKTDYLRSIIGRHHVDAVRRAALEVGYIDRDCSYRAGRRSQTYWLLPPHDSAPARRREIADFALRRNLGMWHDSRRRQTARAQMPGVDAAVHEHLRRNLRRVTIDSAIDAAGQLPAARQIAVEDLLRGEARFFSVDRFGRMHTSMTNFPRDYRRFLRVDGKPLVNVDVGEAQPIFVAIFCANFFDTDINLKGGIGPKTRDLPPSHTLYDGQTMMDNRHPNGVVFGRLDRAALPADLRAFLELCEGRGLYQAVADRLNKTRIEVKKRVLAALFDRAWRRNAVSDALDELFPTVMEVLRRVKQPDHRRLAHVAQRMESGFMFGRVVPRIMAERPELFVATIHDSILTTRGNEEYVRQVMLDEFARLGLSPQVRAEPCG
jgi:hypothetical protein